METLRSLALVLIPPGNVIKAISDYRASLWSSRGLATARAWFDFPVIAWLGARMDDHDSSGFAEGCSFPFELLSPARIGTYICLPFPESIQSFLSSHTNVFPTTDGNSAYHDGPFESGAGCWCASTEPEDASPVFDVPKSPDFPIRARSYMVAHIELHWSKEKPYTSSWHTVSAIRARGIR